MLTLLSLKLSISLYLLLATLFYSLLILSPAYSADYNPGLFVRATHFDPAITKQLWGKMSPSAQVEFAREGKGEYIVVLNDVDWKPLGDLGAKSLTEMSTWRKQKRKEIEQIIKQKVALVSNQLKFEQLRIIATFKYLPLLKVEIAHPRALSKLLQIPDVKNVLAEQYYKKSLTQSLPIINQPMAFNGNLDGEGVTTAIFDTGLDYTAPPFFCAQPLGSIPDETDSCKVVAVYETAIMDNSLDDDGHGTQVSEVVHSVAPSSGIISMDVFEVDSNGNRLASSTDINEAVDILIDIKDQFNVVVANFSLGTNTLYQNECSQIFISPPPRTIDNPLRMAMEILSVNSILPIAASGNDSSSSEISSPACIDETLSIGATYDQAFASVQYSACTDSNPVVDDIPCYSNSNHLLELLAPGSIINGNAGTSFAAPHVTGVAAVAAALFEDTNITDLRQRLLSSDTVIVDSRNSLSFPRLSMSSALQPDNDDFVNAEFIMITDIIVGNSTFSSVESGETTSTSVWYSLTPTETGHYLVNLSSAEPQTANLYTGSDLTELVLTGSSSSQTNNKVYLQSGTNYLIQIASSSFGGEFELSFDLIRVTTQVPFPFWIYPGLIILLTGVVIFKTSTKNIKSNNTPG